MLPPASKANTIAAIGSNPKGTLAFVNQRHVAAAPHTIPSHTQPLIFTLLNVRHQSSAMSCVHVYMSCVHVLRPEGT
jgi:hypothetical protein